MKFKFVPLAPLLLALVGGAALALVRPLKPAIGVTAFEVNKAQITADARAATGRRFDAIESSSQVNTATVTWKGGQDNRWSNPANWEDGHVPGAADVARFAGGDDSRVLLDADSPGAVAGLILEADYRGTLSLGRGLTVNNEIMLAGGALDQGNFSLSAKRYLQTGGQLIGGGGSFTIQEAAIVRGGMLLTSKSLTAESLTIEAPAVVTMAANSKLSLTGDGEPLKGNGRLDARTNRPNSLEYTGQATADVTAATPLKREALGRAAPSRSQMISRLKAVTPQEPSALGVSSFTRAGALTLNAEERSAMCAVIDTANGYAYFGTMTSPGIVVKVRLSDFKRVGALVLRDGEDQLRSAVIDTVHGFAYFGTVTNPGKVVKIRLSDFTRVGALTLERDEGTLAAAVIDTANGYAYFGTFTSPGIIVKIRLSDFTRVGALYLRPEEAGLLTAVIDPAKGFAYFGTDTVPGIIVKVRLSDFTRVDSLTLNNDEDELTCSVIDTANGYAYFGTFTLVPHIVKVRLSDLTRVGAINLNDGVTSFLRAGVIDQANGFAYFAPDDTPGRIIKVRLSNFSFVGYLTLNLTTGEDLLASGVIDPAKGFAYFSGDSQVVVKIRLSDFTRVAATPLSKGENNLECAVIDTANGYAYFGANNPSLIVKVRLSDFKRVGVLNMRPGEWNLGSAAIDTANGYAYFGTYDTSPGKVIKVRLSDFTRVSALTLEPGEENLWAAVLDPGNGFAYFGTGTDPSIVVKIRLSDFTRVGALVTGQYQHRSGVIDTSKGFAYFGGGSGVVKVRLSDFTRAGALAYNEWFQSAVIDTSNGFAYFGSTDGKVAKIRLSDFTRAGILTLNFGEDYLYSAVIDPANGFAYFGTASTQPGSVVKVRLSDLTRVEALTLNNKENNLYSAVIDTTHAYAYFGTATHPGRIVKIDLLGRATPLQPPTPTSPGAASAPGTEVANTTPTFHWAASTGATRYALLISKYPYDPINAVYYNEDLTGTSFTLPSGVLEDGERYFWYMRSYGSWGESAYSSGLYFSVGPPPALPSATTTAATLVKGTTATLNGSVNPNGEAASGWFEWGSSSTLSTYTSTLTQSIEPGTTNVAISKGLTGLTPNTTYYFRAAAATNGGIVKGSILSFKTLAIPGLRVNNISVTEANTGSNTSATFTVSLSAASNEAVSVNYVTANGTAVSTKDYTALPQTTLTFTPGQTSKTVTVQVKGDTLDEANEVFGLTLSNPTNATLEVGQGICTILDDDPSPKITISNAASVTEPDTGAVYAIFTVTLSALSGQPISFKYATANGTASAGTDYTAIPSTILTFSAGQTSKPIRVLVKGDTLREPNETFFVNLTGAVNATIADAQGQCTIINDD
jgi:hypothetical protein